MTEPGDLHLDAGGLRLHALTWGDPAAPPVVLLHGSSGHAHLWDVVAAALADRYRLLALDLRGHGDSERPAPPSYRLTDYAADVRAVLGSLALPPVALIGHSLGALVALQLVGEGGVPLRGLALLDIEASPPPHQAQRLNEAGSRPAPRFASLDEVVAFEARSLPEVPRERLAWIAALGVRTLADGTLEQKADREALRGFEQADFHPSLSRITCPTLVLRGARSAVMRHEVAERMAADLPRGRFAEIPEAGHQLIIEQPEAVAEALRTWLDHNVPWVEGGEDQ